MLKIRYIAPNEQCISGVLPQVVGIHVAKQFPVEPLLILLTVAARARVRIVAKWVRIEYLMQVFDGGVKLVCFFHSVILSVRKHPYRR